MKTLTRWIPLYLTLTALEGLMAIAWIVAQPSEAGSAVFLGLSKQRLFLALCIFSLAVVCGAAAVWLRRHAAQLPSITNSLERILLEKAYLTPLLISLSLWVLIAAALIWGLMQFPENAVSLYAILGEGVVPLYAVGQRLMPLLVWAGLAALQAGVILISLYLHFLRQPAAWPLKKLLAALGLFILASATLCHWIILIFQLEVFSHIPGWFWGFSYKSTDPQRLIVFIVMLLVLLAVSWLIAGRRLRPAWLLLVLFLAGWGMQYGLGLAEGQGLDSLRQRFFSTMHKSYALSACGKGESLTEIVGNYENTYGMKFFPGTKPPGVILSYAVIERGLNAINPMEDTTARCDRLGQAIAWGFPPFTFLIVFLLYALVSGADRVLHAQTRYLASLLVISAPAYILFALFLDETLYPILFLGGVWLMVATVRSRSAWLALLSGCFLYLSIFISFTMLPLFAFLGFYWLVSLWQKEGKWNWKLDIGKLLLGLAGFGLIHFLFMHFLNYDFVVRYQNAMQGLFDVSYFSKPGSLKVGETMQLADRFRLVSQAIALNNIEFATAIGLPFYALFIVQAVRQAGALIKRRLTPLQLITFACFLTFVALNLISQTRSESARLWLFWVPVVALFAGMELEKHMKRYPWVLYIYIFAQWGTLFLLYMFQELK